MLSAHWRLLRGSNDVVPTHAAPPSDSDGETGARYARGARALLLLLHDGRALSGHCWLTRGNHPALRRSGMY